MVRKPLPHAEKSRKRQENEDDFDNDEPYSKEELNKEIDEIKRLFAGKIGAKEFAEIISQNNQTKNENENQNKGMKI